MRAVFVDTSAWLTLMNRNDRYHDTAVQYHRSLDPLTRRISTWGVISETYTLLRCHEGYQHAALWLHESTALRQSRVLDVVFPTADVEIGIHDNLSRFADQDLSYVDALSLYVIKSRDDIDAVFALDHHLALAGKPVWPGPLPVGKR